MNYLRKYYPGYTARVLALLTCLAISACGGGGGGNGSNGGTNPGAPPATSVQVTQGPIDGFGSVIVHGIHFDTNGSDFIIDDDPGVQDQLRVGQIVTIVGEHDGRRGTAKSVKYDKNLEGIVTSVDVANSQFVALGQTVIVDAMTIFERVSLDTLTVGDFVEVSGFIDADGNIRATFVELELTPPVEQELHGLISNLDTATNTFTINAQVVDYSTASVIEVSGGMLQNGQFVEVKGSVNGTVFIAAKIEEERESRDRDDRFRVEGFITALRLANNEFDLGSLTVRFNNATQFRRGSSSDLALNREVEVEGSIDDQGTLIAREIEFEAHDAIEIEAFVDAVDINAGTVDLLGITISVNANTRIRDKRDDIPDFNISDIAVGDFLEIRAVEDAGTYAAGRLERDKADNDISLQGFVDAIDVSANTLTLESVVVDFSSPSVEFEEVNGSPLSKDAFLSALSIGSLIEVKGSYNGSSILAEELEFEDD